MIRVIIGSKFRAPYALYFEPADRYRVLDADQHWQTKRAADLQSGDVLEARGKIVKCERLDGATA